MSQIVPFGNNNRFKRSTRTTRKGLYSTRSLPMSVGNQLVPMDMSMPRSSNSSGYSSNLGNYKSSGTGKFYRISTNLNPRNPRPEVKYLDQGLGNPTAPVPISNSGANMYLINPIPQGITGQSRIGQQCGIKSCYYQFVLNFGTTTAPIALRHILFWDRQTNGLTPGATDLLANSSSLVTAPLNLVNRDRFVIIADDRTTLSPQGDGIRIIEGFRKINQITTWADSLNTTPITGGLFALFISDEVTTELLPNLYGTWRTRFVDN